MKNQKKIMLAMLTLLTALPTLADDDCEQHWTEACIGNPYGFPPNVSNAGDKLFLLGGLGIAAYFYLSADSTDPMTYTRLLNDYKQGRGLRLTSYENELNVSLLAITKLDKYQHPGFTPNSLDNKKSMTINLLNVSADF